MTMVPRLKVGLDSSFDLIVKRLNDEGESVAHEVLPRRWVELIRYLDEQEAKQAQDPRMDKHVKRRGH
jgi:hypothetical protein